MEAPWVYFLSRRRERALGSPHTLRVSHRSTRVKPRISIVIPTHNRSGILVQTLNSLAVQTVPADVYDVTVVADGCRDDTAARVRSLSLPYAVRLIEQSPRGPLRHAIAARPRSHPR